MLRWRLASDRKQPASNLLNRHLRPRPWTRNDVHVHSAHSFNYFLTTMPNYAKNPAQTYATEINSIPPATIISYLHQINEVGLDRILELPIGIFSDRDALLNYIGEELHTLTETHNPWPENAFSFFNFTDEDFYAFATSVSAEDDEFSEDQGLELHQEPTTQDAAGFEDVIHPAGESRIPQNVEEIHSHADILATMNPSAPIYAASAVLLVLNGVHDFCFESSSGP